MSKRKQLIVGLGLLVTIVGGGLLALHFLKAKVGEKCDATSDCRGGLVCLNRRCKQECSSDADCATGWSCRGVAGVVLKTTEGGVLSNRKIESARVKICYSPEAMAPLLAKEARDKQQAVDRNAAIQAELDYSLKKSSVYTEVIVLALKPTASGAPGRSVSKAEFDAAWDALPEADRRKLAAKDLAARIVANVAANLPVPTGH